MSRTIQASRRLEYPPGLKPVATRAGTPPMRSNIAIAPAKCWQYPSLVSLMNASSGASPGLGGVGRSE